MRQTKGSGLGQSQDSLRIDGGGAYPFPATGTATDTALSCPMFLRTARTPSLPCLWRNSAPLSVSSVSPW